MPNVKSCFKFKPSSREILKSRTNSLSRDILLLLHKPVMEPWHLRQCISLYYISTWEVLALYGSLWISQSNYFSNRLLNFLSFSSGWDAWTAIIECFFALRLKESYFRLLRTGNVTNIKIHSFIHFNWLIQIYHYIFSLPTSSKN